MNYKERLAKHQWKPGNTGAKTVYEHSSLSILFSFPLSTFLSCLCTFHPLKPHALSPLSPYSPLCLSLSPHTLSLLHIPPLVSSLNADFAFTILLLLQETKLVENHECKHYKLSFEYPLYTLHAKRGKKLKWSEKTRETEKEYGVQHMIEL